MAMPLGHLKEELTGDGAGAVVGAVGAGAQLHPTSMATAKSAVTANIISLTLFLFIFTSLLTEEL
jgi:hypothetical protein